MDSGQVWSILLLTAIFVITLVKMLWTYEAQSIRLRHYCHYVKLLNW